MEMIQRIPGVAKSLEKTTQTSYADSPCVNDIWLIDIPKTIPNMKLYNESTDPQEHMRIFIVPIRWKLREPYICKELVRQ